jgi:hypothetical protein
VNPIARDLAAFRHALRDVELDEREVHVLVDAASSWDLATVEVVCSLFEKVRKAGGVQILDLQNQIHDKAREIQRQDNHPEVPGNSGPGW